MTITFSNLGKSLKKLITPNYLVMLPMHRRSTTVSLETYHLYSFVIHNSSYIFTVDFWPSRIARLIHIWKGKKIRCVTNSKNWLELVTMQHELWLTYTRGRFSQLHYERCNRPAGWRKRTVKCHLELAKSCVSRTKSRFARAVRERPRTICS